MKKKPNLWSLLTAVCVVLGIFSLSRTFSELTHHNGTPKSIALHVISGVLWLAIAWVISRRRQKNGEGEIPPTELASSIQKKLALPYKLVPDKVPPDALMRFFRRTRKEARGQFTPVLVPVEEALDRMLDGRALVALRLETGRTHQIRVHLSHIGCPVKGDFLYGTERPEAFPGCFALHSALLEVRHPVTGKMIRVTSLPEWAKEVDPSVLLLDFD